MGVEEHVMDADRIAELRKIIEGATPGPWLTPSGPKPPLSYRQLSDVMGPDEGAPGELFHIAGDAFIEDAAFVAAARTALPEALDAIERLRDEIARLSLCLDCREGVHDHGSSCDDYLEFACHCNARS